MFSQFLIIDQRRIIIFCLGMLEKHHKYKIQCIKRQNTHIVKHIIFYQNIETLTLIRFWLFGTSIFLRSSQIK